jgi:hypothetical protein
MTTAARRDLLASKYDQVLDAVFLCYQQNPLGHRIPTLIRDFVVGDGLSYTASNPNIEDIVGEIWNDEDVPWDDFVPKWALELGLYGEWIPEVFVGDVAGGIKLGYIDPFQVKSVPHAKGNPLIPDAVHLKTGGDIHAGETLDIIRRRDGVLAGDVFYFKVNSMSNSTRGWSDLLHLADWLDALDQEMWEVLERARLMRTFIWDVVLKGADETRLRQWLTQHRDPPRSGTVRAHNENETWTAVAPTLGSMETSEDVNIIREHIAGGAGLPKHWLAAAEDVNRATAREMGTPTEKTLQQRQRFFVRCLHRIIRFGLEKAQEAGRLKDVDDEGKMAAYDEDGAQTDQREHPWDLVQIHAPDVSQRDMMAAGSLIVNLVNALAVAEERGWFGAKNVRQVLALALGQLGYDFDPATVPMDEEVVSVDGQGNPIPPETGKAGEPPSRVALNKATALPTPAKTTGL